MRGIYKITNIKNNKVYIGESLNIVKRWSEHINQLRSNTHYNHKLQCDFNKYGVDSFKFEVLLALDDSIKNYVDKYLLVFYEDKYIKKYNSIHNGYNIENTLESLISNKRNFGNQEFNIDMYKKCTKNISKKIYVKFGGILFHNEYNNSQKKTISKLNNKIVAEEAKTPSEKLKLDIETWLDSHNIQYEIHKKISPIGGKVFYFNYYFEYNNKFYAIDIYYKNDKNRTRKTEYSKLNNINAIFIPVFWYNASTKLNFILEDTL